MGGLLPATTAQPPHQCFQWVTGNRRNRRRTAAKNRRSNHFNDFQITAATAASGHSAPSDVGTIFSPDITRSGPYYTTVMLPEANRPSMARPKARLSYPCLPGCFANSLGA